MVKGTRDIYWLSSQASNLLDDKIEVLRRFQIEVNLIDDFPTLARVFTQKRLGTIIISDQFKDAKWKDYLQTLSIHPEYAGVRFLLSLSKPDRELCDLVASLGFRDIIPLDLKADHWIKRYFFSASGQASDLPEPLPQISSRHIAAVHVPARISWMTENEFWLETRLVPPVGTQLHISGGPAAFLGLKKLSFRVLEHHQTHLHFRYSDALLCRWDLPREESDKKKTLLDFLKQQKQTDPFRIYSIVRSKDFRKEILMQLEPNRFQLSIALNKTNMIHEPRYIGPDGIIIEDKMCLGVHRENFARMMELLPQDIPVFVIGPDTAEDPFRDIPRSSNIIKIESLPKNLAQILSEKIVAPRLVREGVTFIPKYHRLSYARILLPARIVQIHPEAMRVALPFALGRFSLCALESPFLQSVLKRQVHFKVIHGEQRAKPTVKSFPFEFEAILTDLIEADRKKMATELISYFTQKLSESGYPQQTESVTSAPVMEVPPIPTPVSPENQIKEIPISPETAPEIPIESSPKEQPITRIPREDSRFELGNFFQSAARAFTLEFRILLIIIFLFALMYMVIYKFRQEANEDNFPLIKPIRLYKEMNEPKPSTDEELKNLPE